LDIRKYPTIERWLERVGSKQEVKVAYEKDTERRTCVVKKVARMTLALEAFKDQRSLQ
jgi:hypothetical protein